MTGQLARRPAGLRLLGFAGKCGKWLGLVLLGTLAILAWVLVCLYLGFTLGQHVSKLVGG